MRISSSLADASGYDRFPNPPRAFTLIEVLLTTVLAAVLLVALWSLLSMYSKTFETGQSRTEQAQLARTLLEQISADLQAVAVRPPSAPPLPVLEPPVSAGLENSGSTISASTSSSSSPGSSTSSTTSPAASSSTSSAASPQPLTPAQPIQPLQAQTPTNPTPSMPVAAPASSPASDTSAGLSALPSTPVMTTSLRPAGLFGTESFLQIDVVQPVFSQPAPDEALAYEPIDESTELGTSRAEDLKTIIYSFEELRDPAKPLSNPIWCLFRRELDWEQAHPAMGGSAGDAELATAAETLEATGQGVDPASPDFDPLLADDAMATVPEVIHFALRYFDGATWSTEWDSIERGGLPQAVEVSMRLRSHEEPEVPDVPVDEELNAERLAELRHPLYRVLVLTTNGVARPAATHTSPLGFQSQLNETNATTLQP